MSFASAEDRFEDIVVTAEKRESNLQDTAIAITAFTGDSLRELQLEEIQDVILRTPSLAFSRAGGEGQIYIRGIGANLLGIGQDSSVAIHQDGVYLGRPNLTLNQFLDVERVEILRGPQGTLYGRNATAGVINVISKKPTEEYEGFASAYYGNFNRAEIETGVGGPISDVVGFRVAGRWAQDDGFTDDLDPRGGDKIDDVNIWSARGILDFRPSDTFDGDFIMEYGKSDNDNRSVRRRDRQHLSQLGDGQPDAVGGLPAFGCPGCPAQQNANFDETRNELDTFHEWDVLGLTLTLNWDLGGGLDLVSISGYREFEDEFSFNTDGVEASVTNTQYQREADQFTQELRLSGSNGGSGLDSRRLPDAGRQDREPGFASRQVRRFLQYLRGQRYNGLRDLRPGHRGSDRTSGPDSRAALEPGGQGRLLEFAIPGWRFHGPQQPEHADQCLRKSGSRRQLG